MNNYKFKLFLFFLWLIFCCNFNVLAGGEEQEDNNYFLNRLETLNTELLCTDNPEYLKCLGISSNECRNDLSKVSEICNMQFNEVKPDIEGDLEYFRSFGEEYGNCLVSEHIKLRTLEELSTKRCLEPILKIEKQSE